MNEEDDAWAVENLSTTVSEYLEAFREVDSSTEGVFASEMMKNHITDETLKGHIRYVVSLFVLFFLRLILFNLELSLTTSLFIVNAHLSDNPHQSHKRHLMMLLSL